MTLVSTYLNFSRNTEIAYRFGKSFDIVTTTRAIQKVFWAIAPDSAPTYSLSRGCLTAQINNRGLLPGGLVSKITT